MSLLLKYSTIKFSLIAVMLVSLFSFKPFVNKNDNKSSLIIYFKGKKYDIPYFETKEKVKSIYGQLSSSLALVASENKNISFVGLSATSKALNIDIGAVKLGDSQGSYQGENNQSSYFGVYLPSRKHVQVTYFENQKYNAKAQHGTFFMI